MRCRAFATTLLALAACSRSPSTGEATTLNVGRPADAIRLDPARVSDSESAEVCEQIFDHLTRFKNGSTEIEPALAESWESSAGGTQWTFHLRHGVRFHDGTPFDADAVVFSFERQRDPKHPFHRGDFQYWESTFRNIRAVQKIDDYTVRIVIDRAYAPFLANLAMFPASIVSPTAVARWGDDFAQHPVGTGAFRFVEWAQGERITLESNPDWWGGAPRLRHLVFDTIRDPEQRLVALEGGAIDVAEGLAPEDLQFVALHPELKLARVAGNNVGYLALNTQHPPFDDLRVRRAVSLAINRVPIVKLVYQGFAVPARGPIAPSAWGATELPQPQFDPAAARALLDEAHYDRTLRPTLYVMTTSRPYMPDPVEVARIVASNLHDIGIDVRIVTRPFDELLRATARGEHDLCLRGWSSDNGDPDNFLYRLFDGDNAVPGTATNVAFLRDPHLDDLLRGAQETVDRGQRERAYRDAQLLIADEAPWVPLAHAEIVLALRVHVGGITVDPSSIHHFRDVWLEKR